MLHLSESAKLLPLTANKMAMMTVDEEKTFDTINAIAIPFAKKIMNSPYTATNVLIITEWFYE